MKGQVFSVTIAMVLACLLVLPLAAIAEEGSPVVVDGHTPQTLSPLYAAADTESEFLGQYFTGVAAELLGGTNGGWAKVRIGNVEGYMQEENISADSSQSIRSEMPLMWTKGKGAGDPIVNLRSTPSMEAEILEKYHSVEVEVMGEIKVVETGELWYHVRIRGNTGYVYAGYLSEIPLADAETSASIVQAVITTPDTTELVSLMDGLKPGGVGGFAKGFYFSGVPVEILGELAFDDVTWAMVRIDWFSTGFMNRAYLSTEADVRDDTPMVKIANCAEKERVSLYTKPMDTAATLGEYANGAEMEMLGFWSNGEWAHVEVDGQRGFVPVANLE